MKHLLIFIMLLSYALYAGGQQSNSQLNTPQEKYLEKSKKQKKVVRILLGAGAACIITAIVIPRGELTHRGIPGGGIYFGDEYKNDGIKGSFVVIGILSSAASIPFFIASRKNRKRSAVVGFKFENTILPYNRNLVYTSLPAFRLKVNL